VKSIKTLGIATAMALALIAVAGAAMASASVFKSETEKTTWSGAVTNNHTLSLPGNGTFTQCGNSISGETSESTQAALTVSPPVSKMNCVFGGLPWTWKTGACKFRFHPGYGGPLVGSMDLTGCGSSPLETTFTGCTITIGDQNDLGNVTYQTVGSGSKREVTAAASLNNILYTATGAGCFAPGTHHDGTYTGGWKVSGSSGGKQVGVWAELTSPTKFVAEEAPLTIGGKVAGGSKIAVFYGPALSGGNVGCTEHSLAGESVTASPESIALTATYGKCNVAGLSASVSMGGCSYVLHANGAFDIVGVACAGSPITITRGECTMTIGPQSLSGLTYTNGGSGNSRNVTQTGEAVGLKYTTSGKCEGGTGTFTNGSYRATDVLTATNKSGGSQGLSIE
jgi:hypothetical protein